MPLGKLRAVGVVSDLVIGFEEVDVEVVGKEVLEPLDA